MEQRFYLNTGGVIPAWFMVVWDGAGLLFTGLGLTIMAVRQDFVIIPFLVVVGLMMAFLHVMARGFGRRDNNYVELKADCLEVRVFLSTKRRVPYAWIADVTLVVRHSRWWPFGYWPYAAMQAFGEHVDVRLARTRFLSGGWGRPSPWVRIIHLDVSEPEVLVEALRERVSAGAADDV